MTPLPQPEPEGDPVGIDPISRQILQRTTTQHKLSHVANAASPQSASGNPDDAPDARNPETESLKRTDTGVTNKPARDKKKGVSFLSRIIGGKKREDSVDMFDTASVISENRPGGNDVEVFSQPVGYIPKFPAPPKYIRVKAYNRQKRDLDRLFLSQILLSPEPLKDQKRNSQIDAKIVGIGEKPLPPPPNSSRKANNAVWAAEFSKDGKFFAAAGQDKKLRVWEVISQKDVKDGEDDSSEGDGESGSNVKLNAPVFKQKLVREYDGHTGSILDLSWSKNNFLLSSSMDKTVRLYHVSRAECLCSFKHNDFVTSIQFHPRDDRFFLAGSLDAKLRLWSIPDKSVAYWAQVPDMITAVAFTPDGKTAIAGCLSGVCILYSTEGLKAHSQIHVRSTRGRNTKGSKITGIDTISIPKENGPSDIKLLITSNDSRIRLYNLKDRQLEIKFRGNENATSQIRASFSDDGKFVICGSEDRKVYVWPTGPVEKPDSDKRPMEVFEAHSSAVTVAVFAPSTTRKMLGQAGDPIYDICNPPPVVLLSRTDSVLSSPAPTHRSSHSDEKNENGETKGSPPPLTYESPAYQARSIHKGGFVIVTADQTGQIKIFREDCAYQKRKDSNWDTGSTFSKKMLGRSGSINTRTSATSSNRRSSLNLVTKSPSTDRILNWRNSIATSQSNSNSIADFTLRRANTERERSSSPRKSISNRFSLRQSMTPLAQTSTPSSPNRSKYPSPAPTPEITVASPDEVSEPSPRRISLEKPAVPALSTHTHYTSRSVPVSALSPVGEDPGLSPQQMIQNIDVLGAHTKPQENPLLLLEGRSYMAWDMDHNILPMLSQAPRTPGPGFAGPVDTAGNPMSRAASYVSQLSSEVEGSSLSDDHDNSVRTPGTGHRANDHGSRNSTDNDATPRPHGRVYERQFSTGTTATNEEEELKCKSCGSEKFRMVKVSGGGRGLKCRDCGTVI